MQYSVKNLCLLIYFVTCWWVESGKQYAFIFDSAPLEYAAVNAPCKTAMIGKLFNNFGYGIAFRKNSPYRDIFSLQILKLRQRGELGSLRSKWFTGTCLGNSGKNTFRIISVVINSLC